MNAKFLVNLLSNFSPVEIGESILDENLNLSIFDGSVSKVVIGGREEATGFVLYVGNICIQGGKVSTNATQFNITYHEAFDNDNVIPALTEAGNEVGHKAQITFDSVTSVNFGVTRTVGDLIEEYYWLAAGIRS